MQAQRDDLRVAVIGAGPAGLYAADALLGRDDLPGIRVDVIDRLPTPFGLVRYGVAPDHLSIRSVRDTLDRILDAPGIRYFGGVAIGEQTGGLSLEQVREAYDAVFLCFGAATDRALGIPGEDLPGSISATEFVRWYTGHPDAAPDEFDALLARSRSVAVIGVGNVAVDVTRVLAKTRGELEHTDMPEHVLAALDASGVEEIHLIGRRGPAEAAWTTKELKELGELQDATVVVDADDIVLGPSSVALVDASKVAARNVAVVEEWARREVTPSARSIQLRFLTRPVRIDGGAGGVESLTVERTELSDDGTVVATGRTETIPVDLVIRSVGYRGVAMAGVPFDEQRGVIPNEAGRVRVENGFLAGVYAAGWVKRGPSGIIGTNKKDAVETVNSFLADLDAQGVPRRRSDDDPMASIATPIVDIEGWRRIDSAERELGATYARDRTTIHDRDVALGIGARPA